MIALLLLALGLAMDAFAVAIAQGAARRMTLAAALQIALAFGAAQGIMPLIGWGLGTVFAGWIEAVDHWIALLLLSGIGAKMIHEGLSAAPDRVVQPLGGTALLGAAVATSIDAAAAGITLPTLGVPVALSCATIAAVTFAMSLIGALGGARLGVRLGERAEIGGGLVLILLGLRIFAQHVGAI